MKEMPTVAEKLRAAREAQKLTINDVAGKTKIRTDHLRAIEEGNYSVFPAPVYIRGTVKNYAALLRLDTAQILFELAAELNHTAHLTEPPPLTGPARKNVVDHLTLWLARLNWKLGAVVVGLLFVVAVVIPALWLVRKHKTHDPLASLPPAVYQSSSSGDMLPLPAHK
jgi:cytoskeletal protein RodZ